MSDDSRPYNPLDKSALAESVADALLASAPVRLDQLVEFTGAGVYAIYYTGSFPPYAPVAKKNTNSVFELPIYVGKAVPKGARKGGFGLERDPGRVLFRRLLEHLESISQSSNLDEKHFFCRYLAVDDIWIPLGESLLIERFRPVWNVMLDGFGNHDPGERRKDQFNSPWDVVHPGRPWAVKLAKNPRSAADFISDIKEYLRGTK